MNIKIEGSHDDDGDDRDDDRDECDTESDRTAVHRQWAKTIRTLLWAIALVLMVAPPWAKSSNNGCQLNLEPANK